MFLYNFFLASAFYMLQGATQFDLAKSHVTKPSWLNLRLTKSPGKSNFWTAFGGTLCIDDLLSSSNVGRPLLL